MNIFSADGQALVIGEKLGSGGEGSVYELKHQDNAVVKIYHQIPDAQKQAKLTAMVKGCNDSLETIALWPKALVYNQQQDIIGFVMPRLPVSSLPIHHLYNPGQRKKDFPQADYAFLMHTARNIAAAADTLHSNGHRIGDVNQGNLIVAANSTVKFIDCDSFQIRINDEDFLCEVGVAHFTPPELYGQNFAHVVTTPNHDNFGLAILIFHILMMGRHPFAGVYIGEGEMPIEKAITEFRYAYGVNAQSYQMKPPPKTLDINILPSEINVLFERAFGKAVNDRPTAKEWLEALKACQRGLVACKHFTLHKYPKFLAACPWCRFFGQHKIQLFINSSRFAPTVFDPLHVIETINAINAPEQMDIPVFTHNELSPSNTPFSWSFWGLYILSLVIGLSLFPHDFWKSLFGFFLIVFLDTTLSFLAAGIVWIAIMLCLLVMASLRVSFPLTMWLMNNEYAPRQQVFEIRKKMLNHLRLRWQQEASSDAFFAKLKKVHFLCSEYQRLADEGVESAAVTDKLKSLKFRIMRLESQLQSLSVSIANARQEIHPLLHAASLEFAQAKLDFSAVSANLDSSLD